MFTPERLETLRQFGLSPYAARAYLALLELGATEARAVSRLARIPAAKVYATLDQLHEKGLVNVHPGQPKRYEPVPFPAFVERLQKQRRQEIDDLEEATAQLRDMFAIRGKADLGDRGGLVVLRGRANAIEKLRDLVAQAQESLLLFTTDGFTSRRHVASLLREAAARGVRVQGLVRVAPHLLPVLDELASTMELRAKSDVAGAAGNVGIVAFDRRRLMITHFVPDDSSVTSGNDVSIVADEEAMVKALLSLMEAEWERAEPYAQARERALDGTPAPATTIYTSFEDLSVAWREAVREARESHDLVLTMPASQFGESMLSILEDATRRGVRQRVIVEVDTQEAGERLSAAAGGDDRVRHLPLRRLHRFATLDGREAFFAPPGSVGPEQGSDDFTVRTNDATAVRSLARHIDALWGEAQPLDDRLREMKGC